jgi:hypothetical protein
LSKMLRLAILGTDGEGLEVFGMFSGQEYGDLRR